jgi:hypothetical protein
VTKFDVVQVDSSDAYATEQLGTKRKFWFIDGGKRRLLFKAEERGTGEDWAEKIACELASLLGLPHVHYDLARELHTSHPGVVCENIATPPRSLVLGNQLLLAKDPTYQAADARRYKVGRHTVSAVSEVVAGLRPPEDPWNRLLPPGVNSALDVFIGYVMLDAWIANQDRHHENWGAIAHEALHLAPTFDHGACLARNLTESERLERLESRDANRRIPAFVSKARSAFYSDPGDAKTMFTIDAWRAFAGRSPAAAEDWLARLRTVSLQQVDDLLQRIPENRMSAVCREFTRQILQENQRRILATGVEA